jgi:Transferase family
MDAASSKALIYWVKPLLPTTLDGIESLPLLGTDKILPAFDAIWVIQGALCLDKLRRALAQTLRDYPHVAGRLSCDPKTQEVRIRLTNDGVPITVGSTNLSYATDEWFHNNEHHPDLVGKLFSLVPSSLDIEVCDRPAAYDVVPSIG